MATIRIYKYLMDGAVEVVYRYTIPNLESMTVQYNTPISPMPLPEEDADENVLVKIEGNSASIDIDWTLADYEYTANQTPAQSHFQQWSSDNDDNETLDPVTEDSRGKFDPVGLTFSDIDEPSGKSSRQIHMFRAFFESKSIDNDYLLTVEDDATGYGAASKPTRWYGSISQMSFSISGMSPIVWKARIQFFVGNVISVFDSDSPESPQSLSAVYKTDDDVTGMALGTRDVIKVRFKDPSSFGATDVNQAIISYRQYGKLEWTNVTYDIATNTDDGAEDKLTKIDGGADDEYYVIYLPPNTEGTKGNDNYGGAANGATDSLTSGGLWDKTAYASATTFTLAGEKYEVKVHFRNTSGDGGLSEDTVKMVSP